MSWSSVVAVALGVLLVLLGAVLGVLESFLYPLRVAGLPVGVIGAGVVNLAVAQGAGRLTMSRPYALAPALGWLFAVLVLTLGRPEGDFAITGDWIGYGYLASAAAGFVLGVVLLPWYRTGETG
ncbi:MAG: hypothetical protein J2P24_00050 [Streptosporangiales bacterium]|nr:hypothetical protein [Streptosporangiales bacterium]MBO0890720.1 hypothetical protein [Acidothermales bacterium]